jgi:hypothetical protein
MPAFILQRVFDTMEDAIIEVLCRHDLGSVSMWRRATKLSIRWRWIGDRPTPIDLLRVWPLSSRSPACTSAWCAEQRSVELHRSSDGDEPQRIDRGGNETTSRTEPNRRMIDVE